MNDFINSLYFIVYFRLYPISVDGGWSNWSSYGNCTRTCGGGIQIRTRSCTSPPPKNDGKYCSGSTFQLEGCNTQECPVDGGWSRWSSYGSCSRSCGAGNQTRTRSCSNPPPKNNGSTCLGVTSQSKACNIKGCPTPGKYITKCEFRSLLIFTSMVFSPNCSIIYVILFFRYYHSAQHKRILQ